MAATTIAAAAAASSAYRPLCKKLPNFASDHYYSLPSVATPQFTPKTKPIKPPLKLKTQYPYSQPFSLFFPSILFQASAAFENVDVVAENEQSTDLSETETVIEEGEGGGGGGGEEEGDDTSTDNDEQSETDLDEAGRLYVGNLPFSMTSQELEQIFGDAGRVASVEIVYDRVTDRSRGFAFVTMGNVEEAKEAIRMFDGSEVGGRTVKVNFPEVPRGGERKVMGSKIRSSNQGFVDSPHKIYAGNLSWGLTSQGLREAFAGQPGLLSAKVVYDRGSGRSRGFGFITFESAEELESALSAMNGVEVEGRPIRLNMAEERAPPTP